jgi:hypothetical protein
MPMYTAQVDRFKAIVVEHDKPLLRNLLAEIEQHLDRGDAAPSMQDAATLLETWLAEPPRCLIVDLDAPA